MPETPSDPKPHGSLLRLAGRGGIFTFALLGGFLLLAVTLPLIHRLTIPEAETPAWYLWYILLLMFTYSPAYLAGFLITWWLVSRRFQRGSTKGFLAALAGQTAFFACVFLLK